MTVQYSDNRPSRFCHAAALLDIEHVASSAAGWPGGGQQVAASRHVVPGQRLFSAYLHAPPDYRPPVGSMFESLLVDDTVPVIWGGYSVLEAERRLLISALRDPLNLRYALLSESCVPLQPPGVIWADAISEPRSRINACTLPGASINNTDDVLRHEAKRMQHFR